MDSGDSAALVCRNPQGSPKEGLFLFFVFFFLKKNPIFKFNSNKVKSKLNTQQF